MAPNTDIGRMKFLKWILFLLSGQKRKVKFLGRAGLIYDRNGTKYSVDSEMMAAGKADFVIFWDGISLLDNPDVVIPVAEKQIIAKEIVAEVAKWGDVAEPDPDIFE
jgi:hypothetical protein